MQYIVSLEAPGEYFPEKSVPKFFNYLRFLQICTCPYVAGARSLQTLKGKRLTYLQILKELSTWDDTILGMRPKKIGVHESLIS